MSVPTPRLKASGKQALEEYLAKVVTDRKVPATTLGVTNKDGELWFGCGGDRVFGQPEEGQINADTSESGRSSRLLEQANMVLTPQSFSCSP